MTDAMTDEGPEGRPDEPDAVIDPDTVRGQVVRVVAIYALVSGAYILLSDRLLSLALDRDALTRVGTGKGLAFVAVTSTLLLVLGMRYVGTLRVATDRARRARVAQAVALERVGDSERSYRTLAEQLPVIIYRSNLDAASTTTYISPQISQLGFTPQEWIGDPSLWLTRLHPDDVTPTIDALERAQMGGDDFVSEYRIADRSGRWHTIRDEGRVVHDDHGVPQFFQGVMLDITEQRRAQAAVARLAHFDTLTDLPNRAVLMARLGSLLTVGRGQPLHAALLLIDLDRLKTVNDGLGHRAGDQVLFEVARRLAGTVRPEDMVARLQGDEFAVLLERLDPTPSVALREAEMVADKVHRVLREPIHVLGSQVAITGSVGITVLPETESDEPDEVMRRADTALDRAKHQGGNRTSRFEVEMGTAAQLRFTIEQDLRRAIHDDELRVFLQPQVDHDRRIVGAEALVRWQHPTAGMLPPSTFVQIAEQSDLIVALGEWMLDHVCALLAAPPLCDQQVRIAVNISPRHFRRPSFVSSVEQVVARHGADPRQLTIEVTEGLLMDDLSDASETMRRLAAMGIHLSIDDFGTKYSSLGYLRTLPIHELKIDRSFVQDAPEDPVLVDMILAIAEHLDLRVVAEGVETPQQEAFLSLRPGVVCQGYLFGRPAPAADLLARLAVPDPRTTRQSQTAPREADPTSRAYFARTPRS